MHALALLGIVLAGTQFNSGATSGTSYSFKENTVDKATIQVGGFYCPAAVATASLPGTCVNGSLVWDSTALALKVCSANTWTTPGAADASVVHIAGVETVSGQKAFSGAPTICNNNGSQSSGIALKVFQNSIGSSYGPKVQFSKSMTATKDWSMGILDGVNVNTFTISEDGNEYGFGTSRLNILAGGNVGIGITPTTKLDVNGNIRATSKLLLTSAPSYLSFAGAEASSPSGYLWTQGTTIGFETPATNSNGSNYSNASSVYLVGQALDWSGGAVHVPGAAVWVEGGRSAPGATQVPGDASIWTNNVERFRVTGAGASTFSGGLTSMNGADGNTNAAFGTSLPTYIMSNGPSVGFNAYYSSGWKFGAGSSSKYGGVIALDPAGALNFYMSNASGNAGGAITLTNNFSLYSDQSTTFWGGVTIGGGTKISGSFRSTLSWDMPSTAGGACAAEQAITVTGAATGAECVVGNPPGAHAQGVQCQCHVDSANTVHLYCCCNGAGTCNPGTETYSVRVFNP